LSEMETDRHEKRYWPVLNKINTSFEIIVAHPDSKKEIICLRSVTNANDVQTVLATVLPPQAHTDNELQTQQQLHSSTQETWTPWTLTLWPQKCCTRDMKLL